MKIQQLHELLKHLGISEDLYYLQGLYGSTDDNDKLSMIIKRGKYSIEYEIYYKEHGEKSTIRVFSSEDDACDYFYRRIRENKEMEDRY